MNVDMSLPPSLNTCPEVECTQTASGVGLITLRRPRALNALNLPMVRALTAALLAWKEDASVHAVAIRGSHKEGDFGAFCAGGDIRFFHQAALAGDPALEDFFTEEYALNHLVFTYPKPYVAFMDGIVMGGGMGISQGSQCRIVTERTRMAMPETHIGLFPDVGGGHFLGRCPGVLGEYLALTGEVMHAEQALTAGLADVALPAASLPAAWEALQQVKAGTPAAWAQAWHQWLQEQGAKFGPGRAGVPGSGAEGQGSGWLPTEVAQAFAEPSVGAILASLNTAHTPASLHAAQTLRQRSPLMLHVALEQVRRARQLSLADDLRMERDLVRHCFHPHHLGRSPAHSETVEGIRALAVDKDHQPRWNPATLEEVTPDMVEPFFASPWPAHAHPLRALA